MNNNNEYFDLLLYFIVKNNLYDVFDINPNQETIKEARKSLINYYKEDKDIFLGVINDLHNSDKLKNLSSNEKMALSKLQKAFNKYQNIR